MSRSGGWPAAKSRAAARSCDALRSQPWTNSRFPSSIEDPPSLQDLRLQRGGDSAEAVHLLARLDENVQGDGHTAQAAMTSRGPANRPLITPRDDHEQVQIAVLVWLAPCV